MVGVWGESGTHRHLHPPLARPPLAGGGPRSARPGRRGASRGGGGVGGAGAGRTGAPRVRLAGVRAAAPPVHPQLAVSLPGSAEGGAAPAPGARLGAPAGLHLGSRPAGGPGSPSETRAQGSTEAAANWVLQWSSVEGRLGSLVKFQRLLNWRYFSFLKFI